MKHNTRPHSSFRTRSWSHRAVATALQWSVSICFAFTSTGGEDPPQGSGGIPFAPPHQVQFGGFDGVVSVRSGDIDGDGHLDLLAASPSEGRILWFENEFGDGSQWAERCVDDAFPGAFAIEVADIDLDGDLDVVAGSASSGVVAWWDHLTGPGCGSQHAVTTVVATMVRSVAIGDLDADGDGDVLTISDSELRVSFNAGGGAFSSDLTIATGVAIGGGTSVFAADLDGDGDLDAVTTEKDSGEVTWWSNDSGLGTSWSLGSVLSGVPDARAVTAADIDDDGDLDLVAATNSNSEILWWANSAGDGSSWSPPQIISNTFFGAWSVMAADMDQDGDLDVVSTAETHDTMAWWEQVRDELGTISWVMHSVTVLLDGGRSAIAADLDGDGDPDLAAAAFEGDFVAWSENQTIHRSALFGPSEIEIATAFDSPSSAVAGDIDGDGDIDVAAVATDSLAREIAWWRNDDGSGTSWLKTSVDIPFIGSEILLGDLDLDGDLDLVGAEGSIGTAVYVWENFAGDGSSWPGRLLALVETEFNALVDIDLDGDPDVAAYDPMEREVIWLENPRISDPWSHHLVEEQWMEAITLGDLDGDGDQDFVGKLRGTSGDFVWWDNTAGDGSTWTRSVIDDNNTALIDEVFLAVGDLDQDGDPDLIAVDEEDGEPDVYWWQNRLDSGESWLRHELEGLLPGAREVLGSDLDRDGDLDLLARGIQGGAIVWWQNLGDGQFWQQESAVAIGAPESIAVADLDDDGDLDVLASAASEDRIVWYPNLGGQLGLPTFDTAPSAIPEEAIEDVLQIEARHLGRSGDSSQELASLTVLFEESTGDPLTTAEADVLFDSLSIWLDDGSGAFEPADDMMVFETSSFNLTDGEQVLTLIDGDPEVEIGAGQARTYFLAITGAVGAAQQTPNTFRVTLQLAAGTAEDASSDLPTDLEETTATSSSTITLVALCRILTLSHTGFGSSPVADPPSSVACPAGSFNEGDLVTLTAAPDPGWVITGWTGSDDDASTSPSNVVTIPGADHSVTVHYAFPLFSDGFEIGDTSLWSTTSP
ncbi:MAG: FG-GAP-like repeat-containing protein [Thermoanaerobaculia bacterium]|nr:FG-GAP-like repeat-containing protein [Thermoanaerobaculia bacterium]